MNKKNNMPAVQPISTRKNRVEPGAGKDAAKINRNHKAPVVNVVKDDVRGWFHSR